MEEREKEDTDIQKPCCSDSQLILETIMATTIHETYAHQMTEGVEKGKGMETVEILVTPTDSETLEIERQAALDIRSGFKGISSSDTTVATSGENLTHPFYPADLTTNAIFMTPFHRGLRPPADLKYKKASHRGETMPKSLPQPLLKKAMTTRTGSKRPYVSHSPYSNPTNLLGVIEEVDEDCENEAA
ncbi:unnamed protein product [Allacma fusca]|uniref:Uncharacterized protein n=1 Tax=Allacma fusca TaxID=39272 RepID=A0A8J2LM73_9HEXA|nr:unnamed protein product [Allacma fusca]